jgi:hypothetical protein
MTKGEKAKLYEQLRARAIETVKTITVYLGPKLDAPDVYLAEELLATLRVMHEVRREIGGRP